jgi:hypothetical protein
MGYPGQQYTCAALLLVLAHLPYSLPTASCYNGTCYMITRI